MNRIKQLITADRLALASMTATFVVGGGLALAYLTGQIPGVRPLAELAIGAR